MRIEQALSLPFHDQPYFDDQLRKDGLEMTSSLTQIANDLEAMEGAAEAIINAENCTAKAIEDKSRARFRRVELLKKAFNAIGHMDEIYVRCIQAAIKEESRIHELKPKYIAERTADLVRIGYAEEQVVRILPMHLGYRELQRQEDDALTFRSNSVPSYRKGLADKKQAIEDLVKLRVKQITG